jgi:1-deoxy-D-xylulose-5-phosphate reductoisomerase
LRPDQIDVVVHPQSIAFAGRVRRRIRIAQLGSPGMRLLINTDASAAAAGPGDGADFSERMRLDFEPADMDRFPALALGLEAARAGGTAGAVLNAANEAAVAEFRAGKLHFTEIVPRCRAVLEQHQFDARPSLERFFELDRWARQEVMRWACL